MMSKTGFCFLQFFKWAWSPREDDEDVLLKIWIFEMLWSLHFLISRLNGSNFLYSCYLLRSKISQF